MEVQMLEEKRQLMLQFKDGLNVTLSTSYNDFVTSRTVTIISFNGSLYLTSIKRPGANKIEQIEKNPNVAICFNRTQITGKATITGQVSSEENIKVREIYKEKLPESFNRFASNPNAIFIKIQISTYKNWEIINGQVVTRTIDFINELNSKSKS